MIGFRANPLLQWMLIYRHVVIAHLVQPIDHVFTAIPARGSGSAADAEMHLTTGQMELLCYLAARLTGADHQHFSGGQCSRISVLSGMQMLHGRWKALRPPRHWFDVIRPRCDHQL